MTKAYAATGLAFVAYLIGAWFIGPLLGLQGTDVWLLRGGLALLGAAGAIAFLWSYSRISQRREGGGGERAGSGGPVSSSVDSLVRDAENRLKSSNLGRAASLKSLPVFLVLGDSGTTKTSTVVGMGLDPELLAGQVHAEGNIVSTPLANVWLARNTVFLEAGQEVSAIPGAWPRLLRKTQSGKIGIIRNGQPPRAAIVCVSCELFLQTGAAEAIAAAVLRARMQLEDVARVTGMRFPVYVLFTKADRISFFAEFVRNLTVEEAKQVVGATLPFRSTTDTGVYAEQETQRLNAAFSDLVLSLSDRRLDILPREHDPNQGGAAYEFPRELRKLRAPLVQFLVDLCKPSQLRAMPFLRGFYFSGVRAVVVSDAAPPVAKSQSPVITGTTLKADATGIFKSGSGGIGEHASPRPQSAGPRRVPQWAFLTRLFSDVLLADRPALAAAGSSGKTNSLRRVLLLSGIVLVLLMAIAFTVSYRGNSALQSEVLGAAGAFPAGQPQPPSLAALQPLEHLRVSLEQLSQYRRERPPLRLRWGLYRGDELYRHARALYFNRFRELLLAPTQASLVETLKGVPSAPGPGDDYGAAYDALKAYLITTANNDKSTLMFLSPVLLKRWTEVTKAAPETALLARKQFDFYSEELKSSNPFTSENDGAAVERARRYLSAFAGAERVYRSMLAEAAQKGPAVLFNKQFPASADVLVNAREVSGAFSKAGWTFMQDAIKNADRYFAGELWVLGNQSVTGIDRAKLEQELQVRYTADFIEQWQQFLRAATVVRYVSIKDAAAKLTRLSSNQTPLLAMFCVLSQNTDVESEKIKMIFQPVQAVVPPACKDKYIGETNAPYMQALVALNAIVEQLASSPGSNEALIGQAMASAVQAKIVTRQIAQKFTIDPQTHLESVVQKLMEDPIASTEALIRSAGPAELNAKGKTLCSQFAELTGKYPFAPSASRQATLQELGTVFQPPQGALWSFYDANLRQQLIRQGAQYARSPNAAPINPAFLGFWNRAVSFADAVYSDNSGQPRLVYAVKLYPVQGIDNVTLTIDGQSISTSGANAGPRQFIWSGNPRSEIKLTGALGRGVELAFASYDGLWAPFQFFGDADRWTTNGAVNTLEWVPRQGRGGRPITLPDGSPLTIRFDLDMGQAASIFQKTFLSSLNCVSEISR